MKTYSPASHIHNFACWTAAAAVRRGFTTNAVIASSIESVKLKEWADSLLNKFDDFDERHDDICKALVEEIKKNSASVKAEKQTEFIDKCTFGRAAKIVSIYLKTYIVIPYLHVSKYKPLLETIYPPVDQILLDGIIAQHQTLKPSIKSYKWTKANKSDYHKLSDSLQASGLPFNWRLEENWQGFRSDNQA